MEKVEERQVKLHGHTGLSLGRINSFSDSVFAVAITLLVLNITIPFISKEQVDQKLPHKLLSISSHYQAYVISFVVIGAFWVGHHRLFDRLSRRDDRLLWLNLLFLMCIVFIPFPTNVLSKYAPSRAAVILYAATLSAAGLAECLMIWYARSGNRLISGDEDRRGLRNGLVHNLDFSLVFLASIGVSFINARAAMYFWLIIIPIQFTVSRLERRKNDRVISPA